MVSVSLKFRCLIVFILILLVTSLSSATVITDITNLDSYQNEIITKYSSLQQTTTTTSSSNNNNDLVSQFVGTIAKDKKFAMKNISTFSSPSSPSFSQQQQVWLDFTMSNNSVLEISDSFFGNSLRITISLSSYSDVCYINLTNVKSICSVKATSDQEQENFYSCSRGSFYPTSNFSTFLATVIEIKPLSAKMLKSLAGSVVISSTNSSYEIYETDYTSSGSYLNGLTKYPTSNRHSTIAFAIQRFSDSGGPIDTDIFFLRQPPTISQNPLGVTFSSSSTSSSSLEHQTILPFVSATFSSSTFTCSSKSPTTETENDNPRFVGCLVIGNNFNQSSSPGGEDTMHNGLDFSGDFVMSDSATTNVDLKNYYRTGAFTPQLLIDFIVIKTTCKFFASCINTGSNCAAIAFAQIIFQRIDISDTKVKIEPCFGNCGGVLLLKSYGDNFTKSVSSLGEGAAIVEFPQVRTSTLLVNNSNSIENVKNISSNNTNSTHNNNINNNGSSSFSSTKYFSLRNSTIDMAQTPTAATLNSSDPLMCSLCLSATDVSIVQVKNVNASNIYRTSKNAFVGVGFFARSDVLSISDSCKYTGAMVAGSSSTVRGGSVGVFLFRAVEFVRCIFITNLVDTSIEARGADLAGFGLNHLAYFEYFVLSGWRNILVKSYDSDKKNAVVVAFGTTKYGKNGIIVSDMENITVVSGRNGLFMFFDKGAISKIGNNNTNDNNHTLINSYDGFLLQRIINLNVTVASVANLVMTNTTFFDVSKFSIRRFSYVGTPQADTSLSPEGVTVCTITVSTTGTSTEFTLEDGTARMEGKVVAAFNLVSPLNHAWSKVNDNGGLGVVSDTLFVMRNVTATLKGQTASTAAFCTYAYMVVGEYGYTPKANFDTNGGAWGQLSRPVMMVNSRFYAVPSADSALASAAVVVWNVVVSSVILRNSHFFGFPAFAKVTFGAGGGFNAIDASSDESPRDVKNSKSSNYNSSGCSTFENSYIFGKPKLVSLFSALVDVKQKPKQYEFRYCGQTFSQSASSSQSYYFVPKPTRTGTNRSHPTRTQTATKSKTASKSLPAPPLKLEAPQAAVAVSTVASAAAAVGASGASVALDGARALAIISLLARCQSYDERARSTQGLTDEQRRNEFYDAYLYLKPSFPENVLPFLCFGPTRGACIRGAVVANMLVLVIVVGLSFAFAKRVWSTATANMTVQEKIATPLMQYSRLPFFIGMLFSFLVGTWTTQAIVLISVPGLPESDSILGVFSFLIFVVLIISALYMVRMRVLSEFNSNYDNTRRRDDEDGDDDDEYENNKNNPKKEKKMITWQCEESIVSFENENSINKADEETEKNDNMTKNKKKIKNQKTKNEKKQQEEKNNGCLSTSFKKSIACLCEFLQTPVGRFFGLGHYVWTERQSDSDQRLVNNINDSSGDEEEADDNNFDNNKLFPSNRNNNNNCRYNDYDDEENDSYRSRLRDEIDEYFAENTNKPARTNRKNQTTTRSNSCYRQRHPLYEEPQDNLSRRLKKYEKKKHSQHTNNQRQRKTTTSTTQSRSSSQSNLTAAKTETATPIQFTSANGAVGSMLWNFGSLVNKHIGPYFTEEPLERRTLTQRRIERQLTYRVDSFGGVATRKYFHNTLRLRIAPYYAFISLTWTLACCIAQGVALSNPNSCRGAATAMAVVNVISFVLDLYLRAFLVPFRNVVMCLAGFFLAVGTLTAVLAGREAMSVPTSREAQFVSSFIMTFLVLLVVMSVITFFLSRVVLILGGGMLLVRSDVLRRIDKLFEDAEDNLMEMVLVTRRMRQEQQDRELERRHGAGNQISYGEMAAASFATAAML